MRKTSKLIALILVAVLSAGTFVGCAEVATVVVGAFLGAAAVGAAVAVPVMAVGGVAVYNADEALKKKADAARGRKRALNEILKGMNRPRPFGNEAEERLLRRTSALTRGTPVDVTPYLLHSDSFAVVNGSVEYCKTIINFTGANETSRLWEFDMAVSFKAKGRQYQANLSGASCSLTKAFAKSIVKSNVKDYVAGKYGLSAKDIQNLKVKFNAARKGGSDFVWQINGAFIQDTEPGYYLFDIEAEYQQTNNVLRRERTTDFSTLSDVYRSTFKTTAAAALDAQTAVWLAARAIGYEGTPLPIINFVKAVKYNETR